MNLIRFNYKTTGTVLYGYIDFKITRNSFKKSVMSNEYISIDITEYVESGDYSTKYPLVLEEIGRCMINCNGLILYSTIDYGDPKLYINTNRELIIQIDSAELI